MLLLIVEYSFNEDIYIVEENILIIFLLALFDQDESVF